ncbi:MAG: LamG domain-containing protein [Chitinophagaceae bacterium]|nr:MAG: LamG domain-containing protein [Chitinophagaceae bacterium]
MIHIPDLICYWDFDHLDMFTSKGRCAYTLLEGNGKVDSTDEGVLSNSSVRIRESQFLYIPRALCAELNIHGKQGAVSVLAWVKRKPKSYSQCEAIAGMWNETNKLRQYCLFLNIQLYDSADQVCGHISGVGGPTPGEKWCVDVSIGQTAVLYDEWSFVAFTYDGKSIRSYLNGEFDKRDHMNPYSYPEGIFDAGENGSDFTVGAVHRGGEMGNYFVGDLGGLAIFDRALSAGEISSIHAQHPLNNRPYIS